MALGKLITACALALIVAGCSSTARQTTFNPQPTVRVVTETKYERLPDIDIPDTPELKPVVYDLPRNTAAGQIIQNTTDCVGVPVEHQDFAFWEQCGIFPVDPNSNLYIGLDQENFNNLNYNMETLRQYIALLKDRIAIANSQRAAARSKN